MRLGWQEPVSFPGHRVVKHGADNPTNLTATIIIHDQPQAEINNKVAICHKPAMLANNAAHNGD